MERRHHAGELPGFLSGVLTDDAAVQTAALGAFCGIPPMDYLRCEDPFEQLVQVAVIEAGQAHLMRLLDYHANRVVREVFGDAR